MGQNTKQLIAVKGKQWQYFVIQEKQFKSFEQIMDGSQLQSATNTDTQIGALIVCHRLQPEFCNGGK
jgi:hypothetical protein